MRLLAMKLVAWAGLSMAVPIRGDATAFRSDLGRAKNFSDDLMMDRVGIATPHVAQKAEPA